ncbi:glycosyltransferase family 2 protein [Lacisediminihabitans profunda]|uniref:4,4'-diaponeurosporenoate glycosyltransferase n=1 Tax=Lacisediminihabitans profunda TaxID=2594790 RepID=A0A5C8UX66_9MICO|nr:glycosyltransferase family 2 protein [Lacisediminihabitans profunda]TXN32299.1 glycosyltransferase [Lacisediminihabitans profunda]
MTTISVVIPSYNDAPFLGVCLAALAVQTRLPDEVIVVDNASTDATAAVASAAGARVIVELAHGIWPAAAAGYDAAKGDVIARLDADSVPPVDWLQHVEATLAGLPEVDVVTGPGDLYGCGVLLRFIGRIVYIGGYFWAVGHLIGNPPIFGSNFAMRRAVWQGVREVVHRARTDIHDDLDLSLHLDPTVTVLYEPTLRVGISARPFSTWAGMVRRVRWAWRTLLLHWPEELPRRRRAARRQLGRSTTGHHESDLPPISRL